MCDPILDCIKQCKEKHKHLSTDELIKKLAELKGKTVDQVIAETTRYEREGWLGEYCRKLCETEDDSSGAEEDESGKTKSKDCDLKPRPFKT